MTKACENRLKGVRKVTILGTSLWSQIQSMIMSNMQTVSFWHTYLALTAKRKTKAV